MKREEYQKYLASREWALLKERVRERSGGICERCKSAPHQATHHLTYERVGQELLEDLLGVCEPCHEFVSGKSNNDPRSQFDIGDLFPVYGYKARIAREFWSGTLNNPGNAISAALYEALLVFGYWLFPETPGIGVFGSSDEIKYGALPFNSRGLSTSLWAGVMLKAEVLREKKLDWFALVVSFERLPLPFVNEDNFACFARFKLGSTESDVLVASELSKNEKEHMVALINDEDDRYRRFANAWTGDEKPTDKWWDR